MAQPWPRERPGCVRRYPSLSEVKRGLGHYIFEVPTVLRNAETGGQNCVSESWYLPHHRAISYPGIYPTEMSAYPDRKPYVIAPLETTNQHQ